VLVVDDDAGLRRSVALLLDAEGFDVVAEGEPDTALARALDESFDVILCDVRMPGLDGNEFLRRYVERGGAALVIMMSAYGGDEAAIAAVKEGAYDYIPKPLKSDELLLTLRKAEERERLRGRVASLEAELARWTGGDLVAESPAMRRAVDLATRVAPHATTVLITGESGSGKEVLARAIHRMSPRREASFVAVNCGAIPEHLLESELFGHVRGAFTGAVATKPGLFEEASGGTLLLDEVGELPGPLQVKLLRVLQEREIRRVGESVSRPVDVRVMAATARDLGQEVEQGRFRQDLLYRLDVVHIHVPPLRERPEDLSGLVRVLVERAAARSGRAVRLAAGALEAVRACPWPGNVRELENALERAAVLSADGVITGAAFRHVGAAHTPAERVHDHQSADGEDTTLEAAVAEAERSAIRRALHETQGNRQEAARRLGISVRSLFYKLKRLDLD
jgi:two-component system response regulator AtoC